MARPRKNTTVVQGIFRRAIQIIATPEEIGEIMEIWDAFYARYPQTAGRRVIELMAQEINEKGE